MLLDTHLMGNWDISSDIPNKGPLESDSNEDDDDDDDASSSKSDEEVDPLELLESSKENVAEAITSSCLDDWRKNKSKEGSTMFQSSVKSSLYSISGLVKSQVGREYTEWIKGDNKVINDFLKELRPLVLICTLF